MVDVPVHLVLCSSFDGCERSPRRGHNHSVEARGSPSLHQAEGDTRGLLSHTSDEYQSGIHLLLRSSFLTKGSEKAIALFGRL